MSSDGLSKAMSKIIDIEKLEKNDTILSSHDAKLRDDQGNTLLHHVCGSVNVLTYERLKVLLKRGSDVNALNAQKQTPLHVIVKNTSVTLDMIKLLIETYSANLDTDFSFHNHFILNDLCKNRNVTLDMIRYFVEEKSFDINKNRGFVNTPFVNSCLHGTIDIIQYFLGKNPNYFYEHDGFKSTCIHAVLDQAFFEEDDKVMQVLNLLLEKEPQSINYLNFTGATPLCFLCKKYIALYTGLNSFDKTFEKMALFLIKKGASLETKDNYKKNALHYLREDKEGEKIIKRLTQQ